MPSLPVKDLRDVVLRSVPNSVEERAGNNEDRPIRKSGRTGVLSPIVHRRKRSPDIGPIVVDTRLVIAVHVF
jgi:hypothetical protein